MCSSNQAKARSNTADTHKEPEHKDTSCENHSKPDHAHTQAESSHLAWTKWNTSRKPLEKNKSKKNAS